MNNYMLTSDLSSERITETVFPRLDCYLHIYWVVYLLRNGEVLELPLCHIQKPLKTSLKI
nr:unnamed protein product [Callosobruchus chinensis]